MIQFSKRSTISELMDNFSMSQKDLDTNLLELETINNWLGGYAVSLNGILKLNLPIFKEITVADIGCGGGDTLKQIQNWNKKEKYQLKLVGIDLKQTCIDYSNQNNTVIQFICDDYKTILNYIPKVDIMHACLFCHHLTEAEIIDLIKFCNEKNITLIINDLERNPIAYYAIRFLTQVFSKSYLVKNDAPLSVLRGFKKKEWKDIIKQSLVKNYSINYKWAFRHEVIVYAN